MPTVEDYQQLVLDEVGDPNGSLTLVISNAWDIYSSQGITDLQLLSLYVKRSAIWKRMGEEQPDSDILIFNNIQDKQSQKFGNLKQMYADCLAEIVRVEALKRASRVPVTGAITKVAPESPPFPDMIDGNDPALRGDVYARPRVRW